MLRCVIIDSHEATRVALRDRFDGSALATIVGAAESPVVGARLIAEERPDLAIIDVHLRASGRIATLEELDHFGLDVPIVAFSARISPGYVAEVFQGGARAFVAKDAPPSVLEQALITVASGHCYLDPEITVLLLDASTAPSTAHERSMLAGGPSANDGARFAQSSMDSICARLADSGLPDDVCSAIAAGMHA